MTTNEKLYVLLNEKGVIWEGRIFSSRRDALSLLAAFSTERLEDWRVAPVRIIHDVEVPPTNFYDPNETAVR